VINFAPYCYAPRRIRSQENNMAMSRNDREARVAEIQQWMDEQSDEFGADAFTSEVQRAWDNHTNELARHRSILDQYAARDQQMRDGVRDGTLKTEPGDGRRVGEVLRPYALPITVSVR
jgi:hypothetical protein